MSVQIPFSGSTMRTRGLIVPVRGIADPPVSSYAAQIRVVNNDASAKTNVPITRGLVLAPGDLESGQRIKIMDGETVLIVQEDNRASNKLGNVQFVAFSCILPNLGSSETKDLDISVETGIPATGTSKTAAQLLALMDTDDEVEIQITGIQSGADDFRASLRNALGGGSSWSKGTAFVYDFWMDGAVCKAVRCYDPAFDSGATPTVYKHAHPMFDVYFYSNDDWVSISHICVEAFAERTYYESEVDDFFGVGTGGPGAINCTAQIIATLPGPKLVIGSNLEGHEGLSKHHQTLVAAISIEICFLTKF